MAKAGLSAAVWSGLTKTIVAIVLSPLVGFLLAMVLVAIVSWRRCARHRLRWIAPFASCSSAPPRSIRSAMAATTPQKTMGIIAVLLYSQGHLGPSFRCRSGSCWPAGLDGARHLDGRLAIVRTMGLRITKLTPMQGFCAETGGAITLFMATALGFPYRPRTPLPAPSSALVPRVASRRCAGMWPVRSSTPG